MFEIDNIDKLNDLNQDIKTLQSSAKIMTEDLLKALFSQFFKKYRDIISKITWNQGYNVYNDNTYDFYEFSECMEFHLNMEEVHFSYFKLKDIDIESFSVNVYDVSWDNDVPESVGLEFPDDLREFLKIFNIIDTRYLVELWGSSVTVIVDPDGVNTEYYGD